MDLTIKINLDGDAFQGDENLRRELLDVLDDQLVGRVPFSTDTGTLRDSNGNTCGSWTVSDD